MLSNSASNLRLNLLTATNLFSALVASIMVFLFLKLCVTFHTLDIIRANRMWYRSHNQKMCYTVCYSTWGLFTLISSIVHVSYSYSQIHTVPALAGTPPILLNKKVIIYSVHRPEHWYRRGGRLLWTLLHRFWFNTFSEFCSVICRFVIDWLID